jgi:hypothetical protein
LREPAWPLGAGWFFINTMVCPIRLWTIDTDTPKRLQSAEARLWRGLAGIGTLPLALIGEAQYRPSPGYFTLFCCDWRQARLAVLASHSSPDSMCPYSPARNGFGRLARRALAASRDEQM